MGFDIAGVATLTSPGTTLSVDGASNWMQVSANGVLTRPQAPYMRGQLVGKGAPYNSGTGPLMVSADVNVGGCWNDASGYWTAPVQGFYMATLGALAGSAAGSGYFSIRKNGGDLNLNHWNHAGGWHYVTLSTIVYCEANDYFCWVLQSVSPPTNGFFGDGGHGMYSIALMA